MIELIRRSEIGESEMNQYIAASPYQHSVMLQTVREALKAHREEIDSMSESEYRAFKEAREARLVAVAEALCCDTN